MQLLAHKAFLLQILIYQFGPLTVVEILPPHLETEIYIKNKHFSGLPLIFGEKRMQDTNATIFTIRELDLEIFVLYALYFTSLLKFLNSFTELIKRPTNPPTKQSINQSTNQPTNQPTN